VEAQSNAETDKFDMPFSPGSILRLTFLQIKNKLGEDAHSDGDIHGDGRCCTTSNQLLSLGSIFLSITKLKK
jgi:hypothetical protein